MKTLPFHYLSKHTNIPIECHVVWVADEPTDMFVIIKSKFFSIVVFFKFFEKFLRIFFV